jgi:hypothetical protein
MGKALLVSIDLDIGAEVLKILDAADLNPNVAVGLFLPYHDSWRLVFASRHFDAVGESGARKLVYAALKKADFPTYKEPSFIILAMKDPFIRDLRRKSRKLKKVIEGLRLGPESLGEWFIEDGYAYRIS